MNLAEARDRVLDAAGRLFYRNGIQAVGMDAIRGEAGISLKRLYQCYPGKEDLVIHYLARRDLHWRRDLTAFVEAADTGGPRALAVFDFLGEWFDTDDFRGCAFINAFGELSARSERIAQATYTHKRMLHDDLTDFLELDGIAAAENHAARLLLLVDGSIVGAATGSNPDAAGDARAAAAVLLADAPRAAPGRAATADQSSAPLP
ncbi:TetR family transcriptional regulator [Nocardiopsis mwathae]|uniref:TetR family transcriptional regulator n=1 Tax=Nocardiopsis mwathae TaxID=1472723 RepID=UPI00161FF559